MKRRDFLALAAALLPCSALAQDLIEVMRFSSLRSGASLPDWVEPYVFPNQPRHTQFALVQDGGRIVLAARASASSSGLVRRVRVDPRRVPLLAWRWKVTNLPVKGDIETKAGDDFAARIYVVFDLDPEALSIAERMQLALARAIWGEQVPAAALCYVWDAHKPADTIVPNAYTARVRMVVADSGSTGEATESFFGDIEFRSRPPS